MKEIYALGVGHNTPVLIDLAVACGYSIKGLYHFDSSRNGEIDHGYKILGSFDELLAKDSLRGKSFLLTMGDSDIRKELCDKIINKEGRIPTLIHPTAIVSRFATISSIGVYISPFSYIQADSTIEENTIILSHVNISHNTKIGKCVFVAGGSMIGAYTIVEDFAFIGQHVTVISDKAKKIGYRSVVGAGAVVTSIVNENTIVAGVPARIIK